MRSYQREISPLSSSSLRAEFGGNLKLTFAIVICVLAAGGIVLDGHAIQEWRKSQEEFEEQVVLARAEAARIRAQIVLPTRKSLPAGENFAGALAEFGLSPNEAAGATAAAQHAFNLRQLRAGNTITVGRSVEGSLREISYKTAADRMLHIIPESQSFRHRCRRFRRMWK